jgi:cobalamin biosynthesis protein CobD/CbiB
VGEADQEERPAHQLRPVVLVEEVMEKLQQTVRQELQIKVSLVVMVLVMVVVVAVELVKLDKMVHLVLFLEMVETEFRHL